MKKKCALIFINSLLLLNSGTTTAVDNLHFTGNLISKSCTPVINGSQLAEVHFPAIAASDLMNIGQSERVPLVIQLKDCQSSTSLSVRVTLTGTEDSELPGFLAFDASSSASGAGIGIETAAGIPVPVNNTTGVTLPLNQGNNSLNKCCFLFHLSVSISNFPTVYPTRSAIDRFKRIFPHSPRVNADLSSSSWQTSRRNYCDHALEEYVDKIFVDEAVNELQTIQDMLRWSVSRFSAANIWYGHGTDNPWDEAVQLVLPSLYLPLDIPEDMRTARLTSSEKHRIVERVIRRVNERIPVAYLTNKAWFCGHEFYVDERVLVPRSPIGELINNKFAGLISKQPQHILDMCTGSGCIAIACAYAFPDAEVDAVDISPDALAVAEQNIEEHGLIHNVIPIRSDLFRDLPKVQYDLIVTNPPYVDAEDMSDLPNEYRHEPELGLASGTDGLKLTRRILGNAADYLADDGVLICEVGNSMVHLMEQYPDVPFTWLEFDNGGDGVFMLTKEQLLAAREHFAIYKD